MIKKVLKIILNSIPFKKQIYIMIRFFCKPSNRIYQHLCFKGKFRIKLRDRYFYMISHGYQLENELFWEGLEGTPKHVAEYYWIELCKYSNVILDIGANTGFYSLIAKTIKPDAKVYGFEPIGRVIEKFKSNCTLNNLDICCLEYAVSNNDGIGLVYDLPSEHIYSVTVNKNTHPPGTKVIERAVKLKKISTFVEEERLKKIDLMKIDVETHEPEVLEGMGEYLELMKPSILIEILNNEVGSRVQNRLEGKGYLYFKIARTGVPKKVDYISKSDFRDYLICTAGVARKIGL